MRREHETPISNVTSRRTVSSIMSAGAGVWSCSEAVARLRKAVAEHGQGGPAVPGGPAADLVLVEADKTLGGLEGLFDAPALPGYPHQGGQWQTVRAAAA